MLLDNNIKLTNAIELLNTSHTSFVLAYVLENNTVRVLHSDKERDKNYAAVIAQFALDLKNNVLDKLAVESCIKAVVHDAVNMVYTREEKK